MLDIHFLSLIMQVKYSMSLIVGDDAGGTLMARPLVRAAATLAARANP
ncbi:hypothetical protein AGR7B_pAt0358 [Agrobacterium deltaense RV3]|nr:hypothetical protein AGR7B_pAt0358 [Agrobacterium deltaense RV3]